MSWWEGEDRCLSSTITYTFAPAAILLLPTGDGQQKETEVEFTLGDITNLDDVDWTEGDVVFANSTCFDDTLMEAIAKLAVRCARLVR